MCLVNDGCHSSKLSKFSPIPMPSTPEIQLLFQSQFFPNSDLFYFSHNFYSNSDCDIAFSPGFSSGTASRFSCTNYIHIFYLNESYCNCTWVRVSLYEVVIFIS